MWTHYFTCVAFHFNKTYWHLIMAIISCTITFLLIIFPFILNCTTLYYAVFVKIPLLNPRILHLHLQTFLPLNTQRQQRKCVSTKKELHSLGTHCVRRTDTGSSFRCALSQPVSPQFPGYTMHRPDNEQAAISRSPSQQLFI